MFWYDPRTGQHKQCYSGNIVSGMTLQSDGSLLLFMRPCAIAIWKHNNLEYILERVPEAGPTGFNDVLADPAGRGFCGTIKTPFNTGKLFRLDLDGSLKIVLEDIDGSNGLGFSPDLRHLYYTDSHTYRIYRLDYDVKTGEVSNLHSFIETPVDQGVPDGLTVDAEGYLWSARWDGWAVHRYTPEGAEEQQFRFPAKKVASLTFAGKEYKDLYVTTGGGWDKKENGIGAGALFRAYPGVKGRSEFLSRIGI